MSVITMNTGSTDVGQKTFEVDLPSSPSSSSSSEGPIDQKNVVVDQKNSAVDQEDEQFDQGDFPTDQGDARAYHFGPPPDQNDAIPFNTPGNFEIITRLSVLSE